VSNSTCRGIQRQPRLGARQGYLKVDAVVESDANLLALMSLAIPDQIEQSPE